MSVQWALIADRGGEAANSLGRYAYRALCLFTSLLLFELQIRCECVQPLSSSLSDTGLNEGNFSEGIRVTGKFAGVRSVHGERAPSCRPPWSPEAGVRISPAECVEYSLLRGPLLQQAVSDASYKICWKWEEKTFTLKLLTAGKRACKLSTNSWQAIVAVICIILIKYCLYLVDKIQHFIIMNIYSICCTCFMKQFFFPYNTAEEWIIFLGIITKLSLLCQGVYRNL